MFLVQGLPFRKLMSGVARDNTKYILYQERLKMCLARKLNKLIYLLL